MFSIICLSVCLAMVGANDLDLGTDGGRNIYSEKISASPTIWKQVQNVTINSTDSEIISRIIVRDLRPNKDGEASVVEGGAGQKTVTLLLKSPTVFRGFEFNITVYAVPDRSHIPGPFIMTQDTNVNIDAKVDNESVAETEVTTEKNEPKNLNDNVDIPADVDTPKTEPNPVVKYVTDKATTEIPVTKASEVPVIPADIQTNKDSKDDDLSMFMDTKLFAGDKQSTTEAKVNEASTVTTEAYVSTQHKDLSTNPPIEANPEGKYEDISKQLGEKIVFGIRH